MNTHYPHCYDPINKPVIIKKWKEVRETKGDWPDIKEKKYQGTYVEYTYVNKKKKTVHVDEYCLLIEWLE